MTKIVIDIFMYIFESVLLFYYAETLFQARKSKEASFLFILLANAVLCFIYQYGIVYLNVIAVVILYIIIFYILYKSKLKSALFHSVVFVIIMFASEILVMCVGMAFYDDFNAMNNDIKAYLYVVVASKLIYFIIIMVLLKLFAIREDNEQKDKYFWLLFIAPVSSILLILVLRYMAYSVSFSKEVEILLILSTIFVLFSNILVFIIYEYSQKYMRELFGLKAIQNREEQDEKYFEFIEQSNKDMRVFAHDIKNHLTQLRNFDDITEVRAYVDKLYPDIDKFTYVGISKNKMLDLILSKYIVLCESKSIRFDIDVKTANLNYIDDVDLSILMNNLLDNAVEAAEQSENAFIKLLVFSKNKIYDGVIITNSCVVVPNVENGNLKTTKKNKNFHGMGTKSIKKIIKKYKAVYDWKYDGQRNIFETDIVFSKQ